MPIFRQRKRSTSPTLTWAGAKWRLREVEGRGFHRRKGDTWRLTERTSVPWRWGGAALSAATAWIHLPAAVRDVRSRPQPEGLHAVSGNSAPLPHPRGSRGVCWWERVGVEGEDKDAGRARGGRGGLAGGGRGRRAGHLLPRKRDKQGRASTLVAARGSCQHTGGRGRRVGSTRRLPTAGSKCGRGCGTDGARVDRVTQEGDGRTRTGHALCQGGGRHAARC